MRKIEFIERFKKPTPIYWQRLGNRALLIGATLAASFEAIYVFYPEIEFMRLMAACAAVFAVATKVLSENTVEGNKGKL